MNDLRQRGIAIYVPDLGYAGAERVMVNLAAAFAGFGYPVDLICHSTTYPNRYVIDDGVKLVTLKAHRILAAVPRLTAHLKQRRPAALLSALTAPNAAAVIARRLSGVPMRLVVSEHAPPSMRRRFGPHPMKRHLLFGLNAVLYRSADAVVAVSTGIKNELVDMLHLPPDLIRVIHNPVVTPQVVNGMAAPLDDPWFEAGGEPVVLAVGRMEPEKNFPLLIQAFAKLRAHRPARLMILGQGSAKAELEKLVASLGLTGHVRLPGPVSNPFAYYRRANLFVLSSNYEGFGNVLVEAMACGTPVVSTDCPSGPAEILANGTYGLLSPVGDAEALAKAMGQALDMPWNRDLLRRRAGDFDALEIARQYLDVLAGSETPRTGPLVAATRHP